MVVLSSSPIFSSTNCSQPNWKLLKLLTTQLKTTQILHNPIERELRLLKRWGIWRDGVRAWRGWEREWDLFWVWK
jgi:hypothetical protein